MCQGYFNNQIFVFFSETSFPVLPCVLWLCVPDETGFVSHEHFSIWVLIRAMSGGTPAVSETQRTEPSDWQVVYRCYPHLLQSQCRSLCRYDTPAIVSHQKPWLLTYVCLPSPQDWGRFNECSHFIAFKSNFMWFTNNKWYHMDIFPLRSSVTLLLHKSGIHLKIMA